ncbi:hypothetical protein CW304_21345 [Bacillus sp. UFRGS-B20]|nr:hypothetical protein CW304_21345 [Bacillus sp. UFRGS-B20]
MDCVAICLPRLKPYFRNLLIFSLEEESGAFVLSLREQKNLVIVNKPFSYIRWSGHSSCCFAELTVFCESLNEVRNSNPPLRVFSNVFIRG